MTWVLGAGGSSIRMMESLNEKGRELPADVSEVDKMVVMNIQELMARLATLYKGHTITVCSTGSFITTTGQESGFLNLSIQVWSQ